MRQRALVLWTTLAGTAASEFERRLAPRSGDPGETRRSRPGSPTAKRGLAGFCA